LPTGAAADKELAKDLAQFTIDWGVHVVGIDEDDDTTSPSLSL
jgi:hypothetical protein